MIYQTIRKFIKFLILFSNCLLYSSGQEKQYEINFFTSNLENKIAGPITLVQSQLDHIFLINDIISDMPVINQNTDFSITIPVDRDYEEYIKNSFESILLPVVTEFIEIKKSNKIDYFNLIALIDFIKNSYGYMEYEQLKNILFVSEYLKLDLVVKRAFANVCYDAKSDYLLKKVNQYSKEKYENIEKREQDFINHNIIRNNLLISLNDLPEEFKKKNDFIDKGLRSLDGIEVLIKSWYDKDAGSFAFFNKHFNFKKNCIQDVDPLVLLQENFYRMNLLDCKFIVNLRGQKLSKMAKQDCKWINEFIGNSNFKEKFENLTESDLIPDPLKNLKIKIYDYFQYPLFRFTPLFSVTGLYLWFTWKFHIFVSNQITYMGKQIFSPGLFKKFEKIPLKTLPLTFLMVKFTFMKYFNQFVPNIEKIIDYPIKKMLHARQIINSDELSRLPSIFFYILYDK